MTRYVVYISLMITLAACALGASDRSSAMEPDAKGKAAHTFAVQKTEAEWRETLSPEEYHILREAGTERAFSGDLWDHKGEGVYTCAACAQPLFASKTKFKSGTGWPSYYAPISKDAVATETDHTFGMARTEVLCGRCGGHLGHVFPDGPEPTGLRYCINSASLDFVAQGDLDAAEKTDKMDKAEKTGEADKAEKTGEANKAEAADNAAH